MSSPAQLPSLDQRVVVEPRGPGEWIVAGPADGRSLHIFRLAPGDWLVSEVGRGNEGRGSGLREALVALAAEVCAPDWWELVAETFASRGSRIEA